MKVVDVMTSGTENTELAADGGHDPDLEAQSVAELAGELGALAAGIAARTGRFLVVLGEFDAREAWGEYAGILSTSHWLSWQCGMAGVTAREHVRVARALRHLPATTAELTAGRLSYSKVRAISRVASADTEPELIDIARAGTADQVDRFCAGVRAATGNLEEVNARHHRRSLSYRTLEDGSVSISVRCGPEEGAEVIEALRRAQDYLAATASTVQGSDAVEGDQERPADAARPTAPAVHGEDGHTLMDALVLVCEQSEVAPPEEEATADKPSDPATDSTPANASISTAPRATRRPETVLHATLNDLAATNITDGTGTPPLLGPRLEFGPALHAETARRLACDTGLVLQLDEAADGDDPHPSAESGDPEQHRPAARRAAWAWSSGRRGRIIDVGRRSRRPNASLLRALWNRDGGCVFPACARRRYLHGHHIVHWADGGPTTLENMVLLCGQHHRCLHEGGFSLARAHDGSLRFADGGGKILSTNVFERNTSESSSAGSESAGSESARSESTRSESTRSEPPYEPFPDGMGPLAATDARPLDLHYAVSTVVGLWEWRRRKQDPEDEPGAA